MQISEFTRGSKILEIFRLSVKHIMMIICIRIPYKGKICRLLFQRVESQLCIRAAVCDVLQLQSLVMEDVAEEMTHAHHQPADGAAAAKGR